MATRIDVAYKIEDGRILTYKKKFEKLGLSNPIKELFFANSYTIDLALSKIQLEQVKCSLMNPILEESYVHPGKMLRKAEQKDFDWVIEIGYLPGVTDNVSNTVQENIKDLLKKKFKTSEGVYTSDIFYIKSRLSEGDIKKIAFSLHNPLIQSAKIKTAKQFKAEKGMGPWLPKVKLHSSGKVIDVNLNVADEDLVKIGKQGIIGPDGASRGPLALELHYMKAIQAYFKKKGRKPTDIEIESIAQTWSEHCKHTIFADSMDEIKSGLYKTYIKEATNQIRKKKGKKDFCVSVFTDNAGAIEFDEKYLVTHKVETHNSPSALDPFGGSITGIVGVNRDAMGFGMGAKPIANVYGFCLADPKDKRPLYRDKAKTQKMLPPRRIMDGVIHGVHVGGNCSGIPTAQGFLYFNDRFRGKPLVFVGTAGLIPRKANGKLSTNKEALKGDYVVMVGGRVGQDGIHGATFSSEGMDSGSPATAVQIGDPITQKKMSDAIVKEARDQNLYTSITDNGAGGISCSIAEMAKECGGCTVWLDKVPLKYPGMEPWQIWISESQERMTLSVPKNKWKAFEKLMQRRGVEATVVGEFNSSGKCIVKFGPKTIMDIDMEFLHNGLPSRDLKTVKPAPVKETALPVVGKNVSANVSEMLKRLNITSTEFVSMQYDHEVQSSSVIKPLQGKGRVNGEAAVLRPVLGSKKGIVLTAALNPAYTEIDPYNMAGASIDEAIRISVAAGGSVDNLALLDNFCWCSSQEPERLSQLKDSVKACYDYAVAYGTPFISGKDSMFNDFKGYDDAGNALKISALPTLLISTMGVLDDASKALSIDFKFDGDLVYVLGDTAEEFGGSEYLAMRSEQDKKEYVRNSVPKVNAAKNKKMYKAFEGTGKSGLVASAISVGRGGLAVALAKSALAGKLGAEVTVGKGAGRIDAALFSESAGRILVSINPKNKKKFEDAMKGNSFTLLGKVTKTPKIKISDAKKKPVVDLGIGEAMKSYKSTFAGF